MLDRQEYKNRDRILNVSEFSASRGCSVIIAILFGAWGVGLIYLIANNHGLKIEEMANPIFLFGICLVFGALALIRQTLKKPERNFKLSFSEHRLLKKARIPSILFLVFAIIFSSLFVGVGIFAQKIMFLLIGVVFLLLFLIGGIYGFVKSEKKIKLTRSHGTTYLETSSALSLGSTCEFKIKNNSPDLQSKEIKINLRFIEEIYKSKKNRRNDKSSHLKVFYSSNQEINTSLENGESKLFQFTLPNDGQENDLDFREPKYWELTCCIEKSNYFSRFILDVKS